MIPTSLVEVDIIRRWRDGVAAAIPVTDDGSGPDLTSVAALVDVDSETLGKLGVQGSVGEIRAVPMPRGGFGWTVGVGSGEPGQWRSAGAALARAVRERLGEGGSDGDDPGDLGDAPDAEYVQVRLPVGTGADTVSALTLGLALGDYRFRVSGKPTAPRLRKALFVVPEDDDSASEPDSGTDEELRAAILRAREWASATALARDLSNAPSNIKDPAWLTGLAAELARGVDGLTATVRDERWLTEHRFGGVLAVGGGSARPPRLLELSWNPNDATGPHLMLVGKGITFDTGGISLKPADGMHLMRTDMAGGAAVIGAMLSIARLRLPVRVTALVPAAENHVSGSSYRPGDVVRHYGGKTTEIGNTDGEGRMVLADALTYAVRQYEPDLLVDVATLTGAMKVALGLRTGGVFATDDALADHLRAAGDRVGEAWWRMPLLEDHAEDVRGEMADVRQMPSGPGGVVAALFLREFTSGLPWAHLDIAGPARADKPYADVVAGATGFAARTLIELVERLRDEDWSRA